MFKKFLLLAIFVIFFYVLGSSNAHASFGVSPAELNFEHLLPGMRFEKEFLLSRTDLEKDLDVVVETNIESADDWIEIEPSVAFTIPKGQRTKRMRVVVNVPNDAPLKVYEGYITLKTALDANTSGVTVAGGVGISVKLSVGEDEISQLLVRSMEIPNIDVGEPVFLLLTIENQGNIEVAPEKIRLTINDIHGNEIFAAEKNDVKKIEPGKQDEFTVKYENTLDKGTYDALVEVVFEKDVIRQEKLNFSVNEVVEEKEGVLIPFGLQNFILILGVVILLTPLIILLRNLLKRAIF